MEEKNLVEEIYNEKAKKDSNSADLARTLELLSKTVFGEVNRFVFELLQNADDAATDENCNIEVQFQLLHNYIVFSHNGSHFNSNDVRGISSVASRSGNKDKEIEKTGYKGIGFKSIFGTATYAHISSGSFSFRFDKEHKLWEQEPENYPWQVIPIWTDEPVEEVKGFLDYNRVSTIINVLNRTNLRKEILKVFEDCQIILFLRRVSKISFLDHYDTVFEIEKRSIDKDHIDLYKNNVLQSSWRVDSYEIPIPEEVSIQLQKLGESECPDKLKNAKHTKLTFAAPIKENKIDSLNEAVLYSYLPTNSSFGFSFLINGDFLMDAQRTSLLQNEWNNFLFRTIAKRHLEWIFELQNEEYRFEVFRLLKTKFQGHSLRSFQLDFNTSLTSALNEVPFVLDKNGNYRVANECIVDEVYFSNYFDEQLIKDFKGFEDNNAIVNHNYSHKKKLLELCNKNFDYDDVFMMINRGFFSGWQTSYQLLTYLYFGSQNLKIANWDKACSTSEFLADEEDSMRSPVDIFFPFKSGEELPDIDHSELHFVHIEILDLIDLLGDEDLLTWVQKLGVEEPTETEIAKKSIIPMVKNDKITKENSLKLTRLLVKVHTKEGLDKGDYEILTNLKLITSRGITIASKCYLNDQYGGDKELEKVLPNADFVSSIYIKDIPEESIPHFNTFFKKIGCSSTITVVTLEETIRVSELQQSIPGSRNYFDWLENMGIVPNIYHIYRNTQHSFSGFTRIDFEQQLEDVTFSKYFWNSVLNNWDAFIQKVGNGRYYVRGNSFLTDSYLKYCAMEKSIVPGTDGKCHPGKELFAPTLRNIVGQHYAVGDFPISITAVQRDFFGFKKTISVDECLNLLSKISAETLTPESVKQIHSIYNQIVGMGIQNDQKKTQLIDKWCLSSKLLATDNTFQNTKDLLLFNVTGLDNNNHSSPFFLKLAYALEEEEKIAFCDLFNIPIISIEKLQFLPENVSQNTTLPNYLKNRINHFAILSSSRTLENFSDVLNKMNIIIQSTVFYQASKLNFVYKNERGTTLYESSVRCSNIKGNGFYFVNEWKKTLTLFELIDPLCELLSIKGLSREIQLMMQLPDDESKDWLKENGYDVELLGEKPTSTLFSDNRNETEDIEFVDYDFDYDVSFTSESFEPQVQPDEIDLQDFHPVSKVYSKSNNVLVKNYTRPTDQTFTSETGVWTEEFVNKYLLANPNRFSDVIWVNKDGESYLPYDFECFENGEKLYIDAKGTPSATKEEIYLSSEEWRFMFEKGKNYSLFRVSKIGTPQVSFERIDCVSEKIVKAEILPNPIAIII